MECLDYYEEPRTANLRVKSYKVTRSRQSLGIRLMRRTARDPRPSACRQTLRRWWSCFVALLLFIRFGMTVTVQLVLAPLPRSVQKSDDLEPFLSKLGLVHEG